MAPQPQTDVGPPAPASSLPALQAPLDAIPLELRLGAIVEAVDGSGSGLVVLDAIHAAAVVNAKASTAGALVLGFSTSDGAAQSMFDLRLGQLRYSRFMACARNKLWWMTPEWRSSGSGTLTPETQFLLLEMEEGKGPYALLLPLIDGAFRATLRPVKPSERPTDGEVCLRIESGDRTVTGKQWDSALYVAAGWDPYELIERGVAAAAQLSGGARRRVEKVLPPLVDNFGWCTWDAFYSTVSARGLVQGLQSLHDGGVRPGFVIIDDGWQMTDTDPSEMPTASELAGRLKMPRAQELLEDTESDFYNEAQDVLGQAAQRIIPPESNAGRLLQPSAEKKGPAMPHHHHSHSRSHSTAPDKASSAPGPDSMPAADTKPPPKGSHRSTASAGPTATTTTTTKESVDGQDASAGNNGGSKQQQQQQQGGEVVTLRSEDAGVPEVEVEVLPPAKKSDLVDREAILLVRLAQKAMGALVGVVSAAFIVFYQWVVEPAAPGSLPVRLFAAAANGPLRGGMLSFFAASSDFTRRLTSVRANGKFSGPDAGPDVDWEEREERLGEVVASIKERFGVKHVYCWHGLPAYWAGVMPNSPAVLQYDARIVYAQPTPGVLEIEPAMAWNPAVIAGIGIVGNPSLVYRDMHTYLASSNVDGVKVDCQAGVGLVGSQQGGGPALAQRFQQALEASIATHFTDNNCINCMCHSTENLYRMTNTVLARVSDDFYPRDPASSTPHIAACVYNSVFLSPLLHPDYDMFHSQHPAARLHAMARAISGGAIYVSDKPGEHDVKLLQSLVLPDGSVLRALQPGRPTRDCLFVDVLRDGKSLLKVWNSNACNAVVGVFHLQGSSWDRTKRKFYVHDKAPKALQARVAPRDVEPWRQAREAAARAQQQALPAGPAGQQQYLAYSFTTGEVALLGFEDGLPVSLAAGCSDMVTVVPLVSVGGAAGVTFAPIGLVGMMNTGGAITSCSATDAQVAGRGNAGSNGNGTGELRGGSFTVGVRGCGQLLLYASQEPRRVALAGRPVACSYDKATGKLLMDLPRNDALAHEVVVSL